jgi:DNA-binding LacI/PurR family transcriptional regulator
VDNATAPVAVETVERVQAAIGELNFSPQAAARGLATRRTNTIGLIIDEIGRDFFPPMLRGIEAAAQEGGFGLLIHSTGVGSRPPTTPYRAVGEHNTDGLIVFTDGLPDAEIIRLHKNRFPMVLLHRTPPNSLSIPHVVFANKAGARMMVDHLIEAHGYKRIAFLAGPQGNEDSGWRELGYREALEAHRIPIDAALIAAGGFDEKIAQATVGEWLAKGMEVDAIFAADDDSAFGAIRALQQSGKRIPEDVAVAGFDDILPSRYLSTPLTTVRAPIEEAGYQAARTLVQLIRSRRAKSIELLLPTELVIRRSCGCNA